MKKMARILIVEDDETIMSAYALALVQAGYEVDLANRAEKGLELAKAHPPDVILLDLLLPSISGLEFLQTYHGSTDHPAKVVVFSNMESPTTVQRANEFAVERYLNKSKYTPSKIVALVGELIGK